MDVVHELGADAGHLERLPGRERAPHRRVDVAERSDRVPARSDDVPRVEGGRGEATRAGLLLEHRRDGGLGDAVVADRRRTGGLGHGQPQARAVAPDRAAVQQVRGLAAEALDEGRGRLEGEADEVDDDLTAQGGDAVTERAVPSSASRSRVTASTWLSASSSCT